MTETLPSPHLPPETPPAEQKLEAVLFSMSDAVGALLATSSIDRFGRAARLCVMGQKLSAELVKTIAEAKKIRALDHDRAALNGLMGAEGQYIAQGGGAEEMEDQNILRGDPVMPRYVGIGNQFGMVAGPGGGVPDQTQMMRDLTMMLQSFFNDKKQAKAAAAAMPPSRLELYDELNQAFQAIAALKEQSPDSPHLTVLQKQVDSLVDKIGTGSTHDDAQPPKTPVDLVPPELLRGHPPRAGEQWGDAALHRGPILHREGGGPIADGGGEADRDHQAGVG